MLLTHLSQPIQSETDHREAISRVSKLIRKEQLAPEEEAILSLLSVLIADYEKKRYDHLFDSGSTPAEMLAFLMEENGLSQKDLLPSIAQSRISDILSGKRKISKSQARVFGERFKVSPALFL